MKSVLRDFVLIRTLIAVAIGLGLACSTNAQDSALNRLIGNWELSKVSDSSVKRAVRFTKQSGQVTGVFTDASGTEKSITDIRFATGAYSFRVPDLRLIFKGVRFVGPNLEGQMFQDSQDKSKLTPQPIRMIKK